MRAYESPSAHAREVARRKIHARQRDLVRASLVIRPYVKDATLQMTEHDVRNCARRIAR